MGTRSATMFHLDRSVQGRTCAMPTIQAGESSTYVRPMAFGESGTALVVRVSFAAALPLDVLGMGLCPPQ